MDISTFFNKQLAQWPEVQMRFDDLAGVCTKTLLVNSVKILVQCNPARERSTIAPTDALSVNNRPCFLCISNRPKEQIALPWKSYKILVNPYPILPFHLTIASKRHLQQNISGRFKDMLELSKILGGFIVLYNGPQCGASAPDHFHFQAVEAGHTPMEKVMDQWLRVPASTLLGKIAVREKLSFSGIHVLISGQDPNELERVFIKILQTMMNEQTITGEPKINLICRYSKKLWHLLLIPRIKHRPDCFYANGDAQMLISLGAIDMAGVVVTPRKTDFERITSTDVEQIYGEVANFNFK